MHSISNRAKSMRTTPIRMLMPLAKETKAKGIDVIPLNIGQPDIETPKPVLDAIRNYDCKVLAYSPSQGEDILIEAFSRYYKNNSIELSEKEIVVTTSGSEALFFAFLAVCDHGDEILVFEPFYANYNSIAIETGAKLVPVRTYAEEGFHLPTDESIEAVITEKTRAILICNPNNPTGTVYTSEELVRLGSIAKKHNIYLISDEVYREFVYDGNTHKSIMSYPEFNECTILVDSISKRYSACGARIGLIASHDQSIMSSAYKFAAARLSSPTFEQMGAVAGIGMDSSYFAPILAEYQKRRDVLIKGIRNIPGAICEVPGGAFYCVVKLPVNNSENFAKWLLTDFNLNGQTILIAPANGFYATPGLGSDEVRLSYVIDSSKLETAMKILGEAIKEYNKQV